jgi:SAM-dependent methyltransferase
MMPQGPYDVALGNCSLEHVPDIHAALGNIRQALRPGGRLLMAVPAFGWARTLRSVQFLERYSNRLGMAAAGAMDGFFQHHHLYGYDTWSTLVEKSGFEVVSVEGLGAEYINWIFERELPLAFAEFVCKGALRHYPGLFRGLRRMPSRRALLEILEQPVPVNSPHRVEFILHAVRA